MTEVVSVVVPVYRDWQRASSLIASLQSQALPSETRLEIIIVDDGSDDGKSSVIDTTSNTTLLTLLKNAGRAAARNEGFTKASGRIVVFMDCDCLPGSTRSLWGHIDAMTQGVVASTGHVFGIGHGFWDRYQQRASCRRASAHAAGQVWMGSSQNMAVLADAFRDVGGFDTRYRQYGFEDRDLLLRLARVGDIAWSKEAPAIHTDKLCLEGVARKMVEAARHSAPLFAKDHPDAYHALGYGNLDTEAHHWLRIPARTLGPLALPFARRIDPHLQRLPFTLSAFFVASASALAFMYGSATRSVSQDSSNDRSRR
ncbi:glycosyltransferase [Rhodanobacter sp. 7MK24]|uniref:glycosyltransferase family 2 protein n=1 Tax=Rhodanobacter sp. 7MK24 TaxID=2775922 RepID=UPI001783702D|nr:glycosyltransferase family A protein [Rhodanobacter sp. 7MK24]MBD8880545.1 glycosyltransferase [Rhodanobacter sp. 7MK24]